METVDKGVATLQRKPVKKVFSSSIQFFLAITAVTDQTQIQNLYFKALFVI
jgi:hypothetical protein